MVTPRSGHPGLVLPAQRRAVLVRRVRLLITATIFYNLVEAIVGITAGVVASSVALIGFGLDSVIEVSSAAAVAWQFAGGPGPAGSPGRSSRSPGMSPSMPSACWLGPGWSGTPRWG